MKLRIFVFMIAALLILSACKLSQSVQKGTSTAPAPGPQASVTPPVGGIKDAGSPSGAGNKFDYIFGASSSLINLTVALDTGNLTEGLIPVKGGQIQTTGPDGVVYTLEIPADSLVQDTYIRVTPVSSLTGLPFGGKRTYAVQLDPEGLVLYKDAILTITPPQPIALEQQLFFDYKGDGQGLGLAAPVQDSQEIKIRLLHFSGYGVTEGDMFEVGAVQTQLGDDPLGRLQSLAAQFIADERLRQESGTEVDPSLTLETLIDLMNQYEEQVVKPALQAAGDSCEAGKGAIAQLISLERTRQLLGLDPSTTFSADLAALVSAVSKVCVQEAYQECVTQHIIHKMIPLWLGLKRQYELFGGAESGPEPEEVKLAEELTVKCLTFELQFDSRGSFDAGGGGGYKSEVKAVVRLQFDPATFTIKGEALLDSLSFEFTPPQGCTATSTRGGGTFNTISLEYITDTHAFDDEQEYVRDFRLTFWPGVTSESYHVDCPPQGSSKQEAHYTSPPSGYWSGVFFVLHAQELNAGAADSSGISGGSGGLPAMPDLGSLLSGADAGALPAFPALTPAEGGGFVMDTWDVTGSDLFASREWIKDNGAAGITESGTFKLYHKPGG
jgi:hypothetical protein